MIVPFKYYLHDDATTDERAQIIGETAGIDIDEELAEKIGRPFYEIEFSCTLDTETGEVVILGAKST